jgi:hypothetical protein
MMGMAKRLTEPHIPITIMLTDAVINKVESFRQNMQEEMPGLNISTSDAVRVAIMRGLKDDDDE